MQAVLATGGQSQNRQGKGDPQTQCPHLASLMSEDRAPVGHLSCDLGK